MRVILQENVPNLGQIGDIVNVSSGYARNFLIPRNLVSIADEKNVNQLEHNKRILEKRRSAERGKFEQIATKLTDHECTISKKVGENDKLFGSVSNAEIADALNSSGFEIDRRSIKLDDNIKTLGVHTVSIQLHPDVLAAVKIWVVKED